MLIAAGCEPPPCPRTPALHGAGGHSHTLFYGPAVPAGQPQTPGQPPDILVSPKTPESNPPGAPYPASIKNGDKTIPVVQALWGSRSAYTSSHLFVHLPAGKATSKWGKTAACTARMNRHSLPL